VRCKSSKYNFIIRMKRTAILFALVSLQFFVEAQSNEKIDTVPVLKYELDTTTVPILPEEDPSAEETLNEDKTEATKDGAEYFLRKEFTGGFSDSLRLRKLPDSVTKHLQEDEAFWYANEVFKRKEQKQGKGFTSHPLFQVLLWIAIIAGFATFLIMYLSNSNVGLFRKSSTISVEEDHIDTNDIFAINYQREIDKAVGMSNYRLAVRLMFLRLLKNLSDGNIIQYKPDSTNFDYLLQLQPTGMYADFFKLTRNYEYSWYGQFEIDKEKFNLIKTDFDKFDRKIR
jgi:hypothetical protein